MNYTKDKLKNMKTTIEIELPELPEAKKGHKWEIRGLGWESGKPCEYIFYVIDHKNNHWSFASNIKTGGDNGTIYAELVRTHREDGTPLEIPELPEMPNNVERVEYFGTGMKHEDIGDADTYIFYDREWNHVDILETGGAVNRPSGNNHHYFRVWYKKEKPAPTELSDLIGEDGQKIAYLIDERQKVVPFQLYKQYEDWKDDDFDKIKLKDYYRWSNSPFTKYEDANPFIF